MLTGGRNSAAEQKDIRGTEFLEERGREDMINDNIRKYRKEKGISQEEMAVRLHVVRQTVSKWETGKSVPDAEALIAMLLWIGIPGGISYLFYWKKMHGRIG